MYLLDELEYLINDAIFYCAVTELYLVWQLIECELSFQSLKIANLLPIIFILLVGISVCGVLLLLARSLSHFTNLFNFIC